MKFFKLFICFFLIFLSTFAQRKIPHEVIKENPKRAIKQIKTLKRKEEPAKLTIKVQKIKSSELDVEIDDLRKIITFSLKEPVDENRVLFLGDEELSWINNGTFRRKFINKMRNGSNENFNILNWQEDKKKVAYKNLGLNLYIAILDSNYEIKNIYKGKFIKKNIDKSARSSIKIWIFGKDLDRTTNLIIVPNNNSSGNFLIRPNSENSAPEHAREMKNTYSVFDMSGEFLNSDFDDSDIIKLENNQGASLIEDNQGSFYLHRNKYATLNIPGYKAKVRIWSEFEGIELSLEKMRKNDGVSKFKLIHETKDGKVLQEIDFELYINNKEIDEYFEKNKNSQQYQYRQDIFDKYIPAETNISVIDFITDRIDIETPSRYNIEKRFGETGEVENFPSPYPMTYEIYGDFFPQDGKVNLTITRAWIYLFSSWFDFSYYTAQFFTGNGLYFSYANGKRKIELPVRIGIFSYWQESTEKIIGKLVGLPLLNKALNKDNINSIPTIDFLSAHFEYSILDYYAPIKSQIMINDESIYLGGNLYDNQIFSKDEMEFRLRYEYYADGYNHFSIELTKMNLVDYDRKETIKGITFINGTRVVSKQDIIEIPRFDPKILINKYNSSIKKNLIKYEEVNSELLNHNKGKIISLGKVFFYQLDTEILRQNSNENPKINLENEYELVTNNNVTYKNIPVTLSFDKYSKISNIEMNINSQLSAGEGGEIFLIIRPEEYEKFIKNGGGVEYKLKSKNGNICNVSFEKNINPINNRREVIKFESSLIEAVTINTKNVIPNLGEIEFLAKTPLLKNGKIAIKYGNIDYIESSYGYDYNKTVSLKGNIAPYIYNQKKHNVEIVDGNGRTIYKIIGTNGSGGYWENIPVSENTFIDIGYNKNDDRTFLAIKQWNFQECESSILIKHYSGSSDTISQYYIFQIKFPKFDPLIYYNEYKTKDTLKVNCQLNVKESKDEIYLGEINLKNYDWEITKIDNGPLKDEIGLRIEGNNNIKIKGDRGQIYTGKIVIKNSKNENIQYFNDKKEVSKVYLKLDSNITDNGKYKIDTNNNEYILRIGRNGYFKDIIKGINFINDGIITGNSTINIQGEYILGSKILFNSTTLNKKDVATSLIKNPRGILLSDVNGSAPLKMEKDDIVKITVNEKNILNKVIDSNGNLSESILVSQDGELYFSVIQGNIEISFKKNQIFTRKSGQLQIEIIRKGCKVGEYILNIVNEPSWIIIDEKEDLDFGKALAGENNKKAQGFINFRTSSNIEKNNINITIDNLNPKLYKNNSFLQSTIEKVILNETKKNNYHLSIGGNLNIPLNSEYGDYKGNFEVTIKLKE